MSNLELQQSDAQTNSMHPIVSAAMTTGNELTPDNLMRLLDVQREWEAKEARKSYAAAMVKFRDICPPIVKDTQVNYGKTNYQHETLDGILKTIAPALSECGINPTFGTKVVDGLMVVTCRITHKDGHFEETGLPASADTTGGKNAIQAIGSTLTYLQRYTLKAALGLSAGIDNDANDLQQIQLIDDEQQLAISAKINDTNANKERFLQYIGVGDISKIPANKFATCINQLNAAYKAKRTKGADQ